MDMNAIMNAVDYSDKVREKVKGMSDRDLLENILIELKMLEYKRIVEEYANKLNCFANTASIERPTYFK